jgi:serine/threonine protein kinase
MLDRDLNPIISPFELLDASALLKKGNTTADGLRYWSPEQLSNKRINQRSDQYSLGLVLFRMITGQGLFKGVLPNEIMESREKYYKQPEEISVFLNDYYCPTDLKEIVLKMLSKEPKKRFSNMKEVKLALESLMIPTINYTQLVQKSYQNCVRQGDFIINFYNKLFELSPTAAEKFAEKGLIGDEKEVNYRQRKKLRHAINMLIEYPNAKIINPMVMQKLAQNHGQGEQSLNITKNEFDQFKAALLATVANYEKDNWTVTLQKSWERTVDEGIEYMKQHAANF